LLFDQEPIKNLASKYNKTPGQIALRWAIQRGTIVMPKSERVERLKENMQIFDFRLTPDEMVQVSQLNKNQRNLDVSLRTKHCGGWSPIFD
jgi:D-xylose reductase